MRLRIFLTLCVPKSSTLSKTCKAKFKSKNPVGGKKAQENA
jgi:hypothetical protein